MPKSLKPGDRVKWESSQGAVTGKVKQKLVRPTEIKGHKVAASPSNPEYLVESERTGAEAAHKPEALKKVAGKKTPSTKASPATTSAKKKVAGEERRPTNDDQEEVVADFKKAVNMTAGEIEAWLETPESKGVGYKGDGKGESVGHRSGRRIIKILGKGRPGYSDADLKHMAKVTGYVHRHLAQRPEGDVAETPWRYSLMNWGHDPAKKSRSKRPKSSR